MPAFPRDTVEAFRSTAASRQLIIARAAPISGAEGTLARGVPFPHRFTKGGETAGSIRAARVARIDTGWHYEDH